ncbi:hypothetical protein QYE76_034344 [Lolium multiflorum]|uniref:Uncharacterized protein n=1 Tax=Lolium multiflorum TaxID=4521 RepID=A0AAD8VMG5_LOLMU|nr:hypothetical protein QYE76_034344 [Lolium multiflorum]
MRDNTRNRPDMAPGPRERRRRRELPRPSAMPCALPSSSPPLQSPCRATITLVSITRTPATMEPYVQTETYDLENGGSLVFERDLYLVSERGSNVHLPSSMEHATGRTGLLTLFRRDLLGCAAALRGSRFAYFARHDTMGEPMAPSSHPVLMIHVQHLDFMLHETRKDLERTRVHNHRAQMTVAHHAEAIQMLAKDRKILRLQRAKKDATIRRLHEKIRTLEVTVRTQQDQIQEMEEEGDDIQGAMTS